MMKSVNDIVNTYSILFFIVGLIVGLLLATVFIFKHVDAIMAINKNDPEKDNYRLIVLCPFDELDKKKFMLVKIKKE